LGDKGGLAIPESGLNENAGSAAGVDRRLLSFIPTPFFAGTVALEKEGGAEEDGDTFAGKVKSGRGDSPYCREVVIFRKPHGGQQSRLDQELIGLIYRRKYVEEVRGLLRYRQGFSDRPVNSKVRCLNRRPLVPCNGMLNQGMRKI